MKLTEIKTKHMHYFEDEGNQKQGRYRRWCKSGHPSVFCGYKDNAYHGEYIEWDDDGIIQIHTFDINGIEIINFIKNPELYPTTPEEKTMFVLKYGSAPFIGKGE